jgi:Urease, gamma subunit
VHLTPRESDKLLMFSACEFARRRRAGDLNLNHPEAVALITSEVLELIRDGKSVAEILSIGPTILPLDAPTLPSRDDRRNPSGRHGSRRHQTRAREVELVAIGGSREVIGLNRLVDGALDARLPP